MSIMSCKDVVDSSFEYDFDELDWRQRVCLRFHLLICKHCRRFLRHARVEREYIRQHQARRHGTHDCASECEVERIMARIHEHQQDSSEPPPPPE